MNNNSPRRPNRRSNSPRRARPGFIINPLTKREVRIGSRTYRELGEALEKTKNNSVENQKKEYNKVRRTESRYKGLKPSDYCGPAGGDQPRTFPVSNEEECRAALTYARYAPNPEGIRKCALAKAKKHGWKCGETLKNNNTNKKNNNNNNTKKNNNNSNTKKNNNNSNTKKNNNNNVKNNNNVTSNNNNNNNGNRSNNNNNGNRSNNNISNV
jgi:hypothetical protein